MVQSKCLYIGIVLPGERKVVLFTFKYIFSLVASCKNILKNCVPGFFFGTCPIFKGSSEVFQFPKTVTCDEIKCTSRAAVAYFIHLRLKKQVY